MSSKACCDYKNISADCSNGEYFDCELDDALTNDEQAELDLSGEKLDVDSPSEDEDSDLQNQVQVNQDLIGKDGTAWQTSHVMRALATTKHTELQT